MRHRRDAARKARGHLAKYDKDRIVPQSARDPVDEGSDRRKIAVSIFVGRHIGGDIDNVAAGEIARISSEEDAVSVGGQQSVKIGFEDGEFMPVETRRHVVVWIISDNMEASGRRGGRRDDAEMRHPGETGDGRAHSARP